MGNLHIRLAALLALAVLVGAGRAWAASPPGPADIAAHRQEILKEMLTDKYQPALIAGLRRVCALGGEPASVATDRREGAYFTPDATDSCVTALTRTARDGRLPELYGKLVAEWGGDGTGYERLPRAIGAAVLNGNGKVAIGNSKVAVVTPALAFDAGFVVAYQEGSASKAPVTDSRQIKSLAAACLDQQQDAGTCFSAGYIYGAGAFRARTASTR